MVLTRDHPNYWYDPIFHGTGGDGLRVRTIGHQQTVARTLKMSQLSITQGSQCIIVQNPEHHNKEYRPKQ